MLIAIFSLFGFAKNDTPKRKFGVVDLQKIILSVEEGKQAKAKLEKEIKAKEKEFLSRQAVLKKLQDDLKNKLSLMSDEAKVREQQNFQEKAMKFEQDKMAFGREIKQKEMLASQEIYKKASSFAKKIAIERGFDQVWDKRTPGLIYVKDSVDMTTEVIRLYENSTLKSTAQANSTKGQDVRNGTSHRR